MSYECAGCGFRTGKWMGFCPQCRTGSALREVAGLGRGSAVQPVPVALATEERRLRVGIAEVDRVLGGGLVPGSVVLLAGEPGVGKSTLLLQVADALATNDAVVLLASAEESVQQVSLRSRRIGARAEGFLVHAERDVEAILAAATTLGPDVLVVDSIQTVAVAGQGAPGGVTQVRESAARLVELAKSRGVAVILVGHVTKDGAIAGPKLLEHVVDVVLYLEGDHGSGLRLLRSLKNRFGATHQVGVFEMSDAGLVEVADPSRALIGEWSGGVAGTVSFPAVEGRRPLLVEVQALVAPTTAPQVRRSARGIDAARLHQLLAVLERHAGVVCGGYDVYVGVVGGVRVREPAADLPVALAVASSRLGTPMGKVAAWGEVGLTGELRSVSHDDRRREEAARFGIEEIVAGGNGGPRRVLEALLLSGLIP